MAADTQPDRLQRWIALGNLLSVLFLAVGLFLTYRANEETSRANREQQRLTAEGQVTDRFTRAIEQLGQAGSDKVDVRLGAIYALERIMRDSVKDRPAVVDVLAAFVRVHAPAPEASTPPTPAARPATANPVPRPPVDIQAALTVLGRHRPAGFPLDLSYTNLSGADLTGVDLSGANLTGANLRYADLYEANLTRASLHDANLHNADLSGADLSGSGLGGVVLRAADLMRAKLVGTNLIRADLSYASLNDADLSKADLTGANLHEGVLLFAKLPGAILRQADLRGAALTDAELSGADLSCARIDGETRLPQGTVVPSC